MIMAKLIKKSGTDFLQIPRVCNKCHKITIIDEPILEQTSRGSRDFYKNNPVDTCGNCGAYF